MIERRGLLLDLDGTLADTARDFTAALNLVLAERGCAPLALTTVRPHVSHGAARLVEIAFGVGAQTAEGECLRERLLEHYQAGLCVHTRLFDGMPQVLDYCSDADIPWGVVTNKPGWLTTPLIESLGLAAHAACVVSGDTLAHRKPHPLPVRFACQRIGVDPARCVFVGDAERDVHAGRSAGATTLTALFGYIGPDEDPHAWGADGVVATPQQILPWITETHATGK